MELNKEGLDKLLNNLTTLTMDLQKEVAELKEDTLLNATHIALVKNSHKDKISTLNDSLIDINKNTSELANSVDEEFSKTGLDNYTEFLKSLLKQDFKALQNEAIEQTKRELLGTKAKATKSNENAVFSFLKTLSPVLSIISFTLIICVKFKIFGMLFQ